MTRHRLVPLLVVLAACAPAQPLPEAAPAPTAEPAPVAAAEPQDAAPAVGLADEAANQAALAWLGIVDTGEYGASWQAGGELFQEGVTVEQWEEAARHARTPQGAVASRQLRGAQPMANLQGAPEGEYVILMYDTEFATGAATEQVVLAKEADGEWRVIGYFIQP